jgi:CDP-glycerol glycerophosphotransferase (TagB/SpsB family)
VSRGTPGDQMRRIARGMGRRLMQFGAVEPAGFDLDAVPSAPIALYFADQPEKLYQLTPWIPIFEANSKLRTIIVVRHVETYRQLVNSTSLPVLLVPRYEILMALYDRADFHAVVYVNNGWTNFQSLAFQQAVHIHVNHGESDKICMVSNQAKAYDRVFVAGEAAARRHDAALAWFDDSTLVRVGRPQLDLVQGKRADQFTITYAPTWEGEDDANNYTSVDCYGPQVIEAALAQGARVIYKPHPRVLESEDPDVRAAHDRIVRLLGSEHEYRPTGDVLDTLAETDLLIGDVSSVTLDHLYLRPDASLILCDRRSDRAALLADAPVAAGADILDATTLADLPATMAALIAHPGSQTERTALRDFYFDGLQPGESTQRFWTEMERAIREHDAALSDLSRTRVSP